MGGSILTFIEAKFGWILTSFIIFSVTVKGWVSCITFLSVLLTVTFLFLKRDVVRQRIHVKDIGLQRCAYLLIFTFSLPFLTVLITSQLKDQWHFRNFDGPSRYLMGLLVFYGIWMLKVDARRGLNFFIPAMPIATLILLPFLPHESWGGLDNRLSTYFIDPLTFGQACLIMGVLSLLSINISGKPSKVNLLFHLLGAVIGVYLSLESGSRTGWFGVPIVLFIWLVQRIKLGTFKASVIALFLSVIFSFMAYSSSGIIKSKVDLMASDIVSYDWDNSSSNLSSVGERISMARIGTKLLLINPLAGWQDIDFNSALKKGEITSFSPKETRLGLKNGGFHNEFINNMVKYGVGGLLFTILVFAVPFSIFIYSIKRGHSCNLANLGLAYVIMAFISSMSYHILDFKFMTSFYAMMVSIIFGSIYLEQHLLRK